MQMAVKEYIAMKMKPNFTFVMGISWAGSMVDLTFL